MDQVKDDWPWWRRVGLLASKPRRQAFRLFRTFPRLPYRTVVDLGAFRGEFTDAALGVLGARRVVLIEAAPDAAAALRAKYASERGVSVVHAAVTDTPGTLTFHVNERPEASSILPISPDAERLFGSAMDEVREVEVEGATLDAIFEREGLDDVDLLKVDIQGAEGRMIAGGRDALARVRALYLEVLFEELYTGSSSFTELHETLLGLGFKLRSFHECRIGTDGAMAYGNALYVRPGALR